jgi:hypothetical protein
MNTLSAIIQKVSTESQRHDVKGASIEIAQAGLSLTIIVASLFLLTLISSCQIPFGK